MAKFRLYMDQTVQYYKDFEASSEAEAEAIRDQDYINGKDGWTEYNRLSPEIREDLTERE